MELIRENIWIRQTLKEDTGQVLVEGQIDLPQDSADASRVVLADARILIGGVEVTPGKVALSGDATFTIVLQGSDGALFSHIWDSDFTHTIAIEGAAARMQAKVEAGVEQVNARVLNPRRIGVSAVVNVNTRVFANTETAAVSGINNLGGVQVQSVAATLPRITGQGNEQALVQEMTELAPADPSAISLLWYEPTVKLTNITAEAERVALAGQLIIKVLYYTGDAENPIAQTIMALPTEVVISVNGAMAGDDVQAEVTVTNINLRLEQNENGQGRGILVEATLSCAAQTWTMETINLLTDAYAPNRQLSTTFEDIKLELPDQVRTLPVSAKGEWLLPGNTPTMGRVLALLVRPTISSLNRREDGTVEAEGILAGDVSYTASENTDGVYGFEGQSPLALELSEVPANARVTLGVDYANAMLLSPDTVEARYGATATIRNTPTLNLRVLSNISDEGAIEPANAGVVLYFVQPGDSYWTIAKSLHTTIDRMRKYNPSMGEDAKSGERLLLLS